MNKRIIASVLAMSSLMSAIPALAQIPNEAKGTKYETAVSVLSALCIMNGDENGEYRLDDTIIRSEMTKMAITAMGMEDAAQTSKDSTVYTDVAKEHWASGYINLATSLGIIEGDGDGKFRPNDEITYREAVTIMVRAAGYETAAQQRGGYPNGYISIAGENKMLSDVSGSAMTPISRGNVANLTNNTLTIKKMEQTGFGQIPEYSVVDKTLLGDNLRTEIVTGQIKAVGNTALSGVEAVNKNQVKIDDKVYKTEKSLNNLLGYNVKAYVQTDKYKEQKLILAMPVSQQNKVIEINADLFDSLGKKGDKDTVVYYKDENATKTNTAVISKNIQLIYNNRGIEFDKKYIDLSGKKAFMTLLDTNADDEIDIISVTEYKNIIVQNANNQKITGKDNTIINLDNINYKLYQGTNEIEPRTLREWDVLSIVESPKDSYSEMYLTRKTVKGKISAKTQTGYTIDGVSYKTSVDFEKELKVGDTVEFCFDIDNRIVAVKEATNPSNEYAYMTNIYTTADGESVEIKLVNKSGEKTTVALADKVKMNGDSVAAANVIANLKKDGAIEQQLITYTLNSSNKVSEINTAEDNSAIGSADNKKFTLNKKFKDTIYNAQNQKLDNVRITDKTIVFDVSDSADIKVETKDIFSDKQKYTGFVYDMNETYDAGVIVLTDSSIKPEITAAAAVVKSLSHGINAKGEETDILTVIVDGKEQTVNAKNENVLKKGEGKLEKGDIIQYKTNSNNEIIGIRLLFDISTKDAEFKNEPEKDMEIIYGKVLKKFDKSINVSVNNGSAMNYEISEKTLVYSVDTNSAKNGVSIITFDEVSIYDAEENNRVFIKIVDNQIKEIIEIK